MQFTATNPATVMPGRPTPRRRARLRGYVGDLGLYVVLQIAFGVLALVVFLVQTGGGARDLTSSTATAGWAIVLAAVPAWLGALGHATVTESRTPGQHRARTIVEGGPGRRLARLVVHPLSALAWWWATVVAVLSTIPGVPVLLAAMMISVLAGGVVSAALLLRDREALPLHDRIAGTRLVAR